MVSKRRAKRQGVAWNMCRPIPEGKDKSREAYQLDLNLQKAANMALKLTHWHKRCKLDVGPIGIKLNRGFSCDVIANKFCKSSYSRPPCWFPFVWLSIGKYNKMPRYFLFSSYHNIELRPSDKNIKTHTRLKF